MTNVKGRWALVTGASRGLGYLSALFLAKQGCNLVLHSSKAENLEKALGEVRALGVESFGVAANLSDPSQIKQMLAKIDEKDTQIDIVLNNAGVQVAYRKDYFATPVEDFTTSFMVNTIAPAMITYHFLPMMLERGFGRIVNTSSGIALEPEQAGYSASKAALDKFTIDIGSKYDGTDVMINLADPGWCQTDMGGSSAPYAPESAIPGLLMGVFMDDKKSGRTIPAQPFAGMTLEQAYEHAQRL